MRSRLLTCLLPVVALLLSTLFAPPLAAQTTVYVPDDYSTIQGAIDAASDGWTILVRPGTYVENMDSRGKAITVDRDSFPGLDDPTSGFLDLMPGSGSVDVLPAEMFPSWATLDFDLAGNPRIADGDRDGTATIDMGCYEYQPQPFDARIGNVNTADAGVNRADVLLLNGSPGDGVMTVE